MYPLCYNTGEPIRFGDIVEWTDESGTRHELTMARVSYMPHGDVPAEREAVAHWRQERWGDEGADHVSLTGLRGEGDGGYSDSEVLLQRREDVRIPLASLRLVRRTVPMTYCGGEPVQDGDWVAEYTGERDGEAGAYAVRRLRVMYVKNHVEPWFSGTQPFLWLCDLADDEHSAMALVSPYMENGAFEPCWEHIHFIAHGPVDSAFAAWWEKHGITPMPEGAGGRG